MNVFPTFLEVLNPHGFFSCPSAGTHYYQKGFQFFGTSPEEPFSSQSVFTAVFSRGSFPATKSKILFAFFGCFSRGTFNNYLENAFKKGLFFEEKLIFFSKNI